MLGITLTVVLIILTLTISWIKKLKELLKVPGPLLPKGIKGNLPDLMKAPRHFGQYMTSIYGNLYRYN